MTEIGNLRNLEISLQEYLRRILQHAHMQVLFCGGLVTRVRTVSLSLALYSSTRDALR